MIWWRRTRTEPAVSRNDEWLANIITNVHMESPAGDATVTDLGGSCDQCGRPFDVGEKIYVARGGTTVCLTCDGPYRSETPTQARARLYRRELAELAAERR